MHIYWNRPSWPGTRVTIYTNCFITEFSGKKHGTNKLPPTGKFWEMSKGDITCLTTSQNPSHWHPSWMSNSCAARKNSELEWLTKDNLETNSITIKLETTSHVTEQSSRVSSLPYCSPPGLSSEFSCFVNTRVSSDNLFLSVRQELTFRPWKISPFLQHFHRLLFPDLAV